ncbi:hypothetical protein [Lysobacter gummosus]|uniref:hypothetical protein n=1 Tax=Lysobacter gummosus TaxID=262324 RepID=UPI0036371CB7
MTVPPSPPGPVPPGLTASLSARRARTPRSPNPMDRHHHDHPERRRPAPPVAGFLRKPVAGTGRAQR